MPVPQGLVLNPSTGQFVGNPSQAGAYPVQLRVRDSSGAVRTVSDTITILPYTPMSSAHDISRVPLNRLYGENLLVSGGVAPLHGEVTSGSGPAGIIFDGDTLQVYGQATVAGTYPLTITVTDAIGQTLAIPLVLIVADLPVIVGDAGPGTVGVFYSFAGYECSGGSSPGVYAFSCVEGDLALPPGMSLLPDGIGGAILQGTCYTPGTYTFHVRCTDQAGNYSDTDLQTVVISAA